MCLRTLLLAVTVALLGCTAAQESEPDDDDVTAPDPDADGDGWSVGEGDCDDHSHLTHPGADEYCDGQDNDCDGQTPANESDADGDDYRICSGDCDDANPDIHPFAEEVPYDGVDQDCDGEDCTDVDHDGYDAEEVGGDDCDDSEPSVHPDAYDVPYDGIDQDCDGADLVDVDGDGFDAELVGGDDCDDMDASRHPGADELCNGGDDDCDGAPGSEEVDLDGDGQMICEGDCDDANPAVGIGFPLLCDEIDNNCDGSLVDEEVDTDGDGLAVCEGDCDDGDSSIHPGAPDVWCDGVDHACDGAELLVPTVHARVQDAIDVAVDGDVVCVDAGTYVENIDFLGKTLQVVGLAAPENVVLDGAGLGSVVTMHIGQGPGTLLQGFTLTGGLSDEGGGLYMLAATAQLNDLIIEGNTAEESGGGIASYSSTVTMNNVDIVGNQVDGDCDTGGGLHVEDSSLELTDVTIEDNVIHNCGSNAGAGVYAYSATLSMSGGSISRNTGWWGGGVHETSQGGAMYASQSDLTLVDVTISDNYALYYASLVVSDSALAMSDVVVSGNSAAASVGGPALYDVTSGEITNTRFEDNHGIYDGGVNVSGGVVDFENCAFVENGSTNGGPALRVYGSAAVTVTNAVFTGNWSSYGGGLGVYETSSIALEDVAFLGNHATEGGGIWIQESTATLDNVIVAGNEATEDGGGLYLDTSDVTLSNVTVAGNISGDEGGGVYLVQTDPTVTNTTLTDNQAASGGGWYQDLTSVPFVEYSNLWANYPEDQINLDFQVGVGGNLSVPPGFLDATHAYAEFWDLHLETGSALIDSGDPTILDPDGSPSGIGAYGGPNAEFWDLDRDGFPLWWQPGSYDHATYPDDGWDCDDLDDTVYPGAGC